MSKTRSAKLGARLFKVELGAFLKICEAINTPRSLACYICAVNKQWDEYLGFSMPDTDTPTFRDDYLVSEAMRKNPRLPGLAIDREAVAYQKWLESERNCGSTNELLQCYRRGDISFPPDVEAVITKTQQIIAEVLGHLNREKLEYAEENFGFGPGATSSCTGMDVVLSRKMVSRFDVTPGLYPYWRSLVRGPWSNVLSEVSLKHYSTLSFVPKDAKTDRPIDIQPHGNIYVQKGIGKLIRRQLLRYGLDLKNQAALNRNLASMAQKLGLATIDLSAASDTIAHELVWLLLPPNWAALLDMCRTGWSCHDGKQIRLNKFSAMGNGYTFELETLIFMALARACGDNGAVSFGDDIICLRSIAPKLIATLKTLGFSVNERKTFLAGRFFESCGADYHDGFNVRPFYFRGQPYDFTSGVIRTCNKIRIYAHRRNGGLGCDIRFLPAWLYSVHRDSEAGRTGVGLGAGDDGLVRNFDEARPRKARHGFDGFVARVWRCRPLVSTSTDIGGAYLAALSKGSPMDNQIKPPKKWPKKPKNLMEFDDYDAFYRAEWNHKYPCIVTYAGRTNETCRGRFSGAALCHQLLPEWVEPGPWC